MLIKPLGILTYIMILTTLITGLRRIKLSYHQLLAYATLLVASLHACLVLSESLF